MCREGIGIWDSGRLNGVRPSDTPESRIPIPDYLPHEMEITP
jgi:hypothetical protein